LGVLVFLCGLLADFVCSCVSGSVNIGRDTGVLVETILLCLVFLSIILVECFHICEGVKAHSTQMEMSTRVQRLLDQLKKYELSQKQARKYSINIDPPFHRSLCWSVGHENTDYYFCLLRAFFGMPPASITLVDYLWRATLSSWPLGTRLYALFACWRNWKQDGHLNH
jgi:hypothetical protein